MLGISCWKKQQEKPNQTTQIYLIFTYSAAIMIVLYSNNIKQYCWMNIAAHPGLLAHKTALEHSVVAEEGGLGVLPFACTSHTMESSTCPPFPNLLVLHPFKTKSTYCTYDMFFPHGVYFQWALSSQAWCCKVEIWHSAPSNFSNNEPLTSFMTTIGTILTKIMGSL